MARSFTERCWADVIPAEDVETYRCFQREPKFGAKPALLAVDLYRMVYRGGAKRPHELRPEYPMSCGVHAWNAIEPTVKLFSACRAAGLPVFYTTGVAKTSDRRITATKSATKVAPDDFDIYEAFAPQPQDTVIHKERASGFYGTALTAHLVSLGCDSVIVCGESTSGCVRASVVDAFSNGFHPVVVEECVYDRAVLTHKVNLFDMHYKYADVMLLDEVLERLGKLPRARAAAE